MKFLIVGLGNPGIEYANTRHNIGFTVLDALAKASNLVYKHKRHADIAEYKYKSRNIILAKPMTYMNLSGKAVNYWLQKEKIPIQKMLVIVDDIALPFGTIRIKDKGGAGGHNGLEDIINTLGTQNFNRLRFGLGNDFGRGMQSEYVLGDWTEFEKSNLPGRNEKMIQAIQNFVTIGAERTMNLFNKKFVSQNNTENKSKDER